MKKVVLHHTYGAGMAWDVSGNGNHGKAAVLTPEGGGFRYDAPTSRIDVKRSDSVYEMGAFRCSVTFRLKPGQSKRRNNLVEGHKSFALYVGPDATLKTTILDATGDWQGALTKTPAVYDGNWHRADCGHDGLQTSWVALDGKVVAVRKDVPGPVRPIGDNGISIGHWPEPTDGGYTLAGSISEVWLWHTRPDPPYADCCIDDDKVAAVEAALRDLGYDRRKLADLRQQTRAITAGLYRGLTPAARDAARTLGPQLNAAANAQRWPDFVQLGLQARSLVKAGAKGGADQKAGDALAALFLPLLNDPRIAKAIDATICGPKAPPPGPRPIIGGDPFDDPVDPDDPHPGYPPGTKPAEPPKPMTPHPGQPGPPHGGGGGRPSRPKTTPPGPAPPRPRPGGSGR